MICIARRNGARDSRAQRCVCMVGCKVWGLTVRRERRQHNLAFFRRIPRTQPSSRPSRPSQVRIGGESPKVNIDQPALVINRKGISSDYRIWRRCGRRSLTSYQYPVRRCETRHRGRVNGGACQRDQVMAVPPGKTNDTPVRRGSARVDTGCPARRVS